MPEIAVANVVSDKNDVAEPVLVNEVNRASVINEPAIHVVEEKFEPMNTSTMEIPKSGAAPTELNERLSSSVSSVNEKFQSNSNVADRLLSSKKSISELIDLNKRLLFVDVLFSGNNILFNQILEHIDEYRTAEEAIQFVEFNKAKLQVTDKKEPVYQSFLDVITKKYS